MTRITPNKLATVDEFVRGYQTTLRTLREQVPQGAKGLPGPINASIGSCEIWPCRDAAVVLTYADKECGIEIKVMEPVDMSVSEFMHRHDAFQYFDNRGAGVPFRLGIAPIEEDDPAYDPRIPRNDFSTRTIESTDLVALALSESREVVQVFRPAFTKLSIYGWNVILRDSHRAAIKEVRKILLSHNILGNAAWDFNGRDRMEELVTVTENRASEFEKCLDSSNSASVKRMLDEYPALIHPACLASFKNVGLANDVVADYVVIVQSETKLQYVVVKVDDVSDTYFDASDPLTAIKGKEALSQLKESFTRNNGSLPFKIAPNSEIRFELIRGRNSSLNYLQRTALRSGEIDLEFLTYDDLEGRVRYEAYEVANEWDRFQPVEQHLKKLGIPNDETFIQVMEQIDEEMREDGTAVTARSLQAGGKFTWAYRTWLMHRDPLQQKIVDWFNTRYGDRLKIDPTWKMAVVIRGDLYELRLPLVFGTVNIICSVEQFGMTNQQKIDRFKRPTVNVLDLLEGFTQAYAKALSKDELGALMNAFLLGFNARNEIESVSESEFVKEAIGDIHVSVSHLFARPPQFGLSKWSSLQASEKFLKAFIKQKGGKVEQTHNLEKLASAAEDLGLPAIPRPLLNRIQCPAGVRYGNPEVTLVEAVLAHHAALDLCSGIANYKFLTRHHRQATVLVPGEFYTNRLGKQYRCVKVNGDKANIIMFDEVLGKPLEIEFVQDRKFWSQYFVIEDKATIQKLEERYQALLSSPPRKASAGGS